MVKDHVDLIQALGGQSAVAKMLSTPDQPLHRRDVWWWARRGRPDKKWHPQLLQVADKLGVSLDPKFRQALQ